MSDAVTRSSDSPLSVFFGSGLVATWSFLPSHAPNYLPGNSLNLATGSLTFLLVCGLLLWQRRENARRDAGEFDHLVEGMAPHEQEMLGTKHPAFRFRY